MGWYLQCTFQSKGFSHVHQNQNLNGLWTRGVRFVWLKMKVKLPAWNFKSLFWIYQFNDILLQTCWFLCKTVTNHRYSFRKWIWTVCHFMKQKCYFPRGVAECRHAATPLSSYSINTTQQGFQKRYITLFYLKGLKSYQLSKFKCLHFTPLSLVNRTFHLYFCW